MTPRLCLIACLFLAGCDSIFTPPNDGAKPKPDAPVVKPHATQAQFFSAFADYVAGEPDIDHTQLMVKTCTKAMHKAGVTAPANYDSVMEPYLNVNAKIDDALRAKIVAELRGLAK